MWVTWGLRCSLKHRHASYAALGGCSAPADCPLLLPPQPYTPSAQAAHLVHASLQGQEAAVDQVRHVGALLTSHLHRTSSSPARSLHFHKTGGSPARGRPSPCAARVSCRQLVACSPTCLGGGGQTVANHEGAVTNGQHITRSNHPAGSRTGRGQAESARRPIKRHT